MDDAIVSFKINTREFNGDNSWLDNGQSDNGSDWKFFIEANVEAVLNHGSVSNEDREGRYFKLIDGEWFRAAV